MAYELFKSMNECSKSDKEIAEEQLIEDIARDFESNTGYEEVNKNMDYDTSYKVVINDDRSYKEMTPVKKMIVYPYDYAPSAFSLGDYVNWTFNDALTDWLIIGIDNRYRFNVTARIFKTNNTLKWIDEQGNIYSYPCVFNMAKSDSRADISENKYIDIISKDRTVYVQKNDDTDLIGDGKRFIFGKNVFRIGHIDNYSIDGIVQFFMEQDEKNEDVDNFDLGIADYENRPIYTIDILNGSSIEITDVDTVQLNYQLLENGSESEKDVSWSSSDESIATVDNDGLVTAVQNGSADIIVTMNDNSLVTDSISLSVTATPSSNKIIEVTPDIDTIITAEEYTFAIVTKDNGSIIASAYTIAENVSSTGDYTFTTTASGYTIVNNGGSGNLIIDITDTTNSLTIQKTYELKGFW